MPQISAHPSRNSRFEIPAFEQPRRAPIVAQSAPPPIVDDLLRSNALLGTYNALDEGFGIPETLEMLNRIATLKDDTTGAHVQRMAHIAVCIGAHLGLNARQQDLLLLAAPLHDIGKIAISDSILKKPSALTAAEMDTMRGHPQIGFDLLAHSRTPALRLGAEIAISHHERWDGTGYPNAIAGESIPLSGRIVAVADVLDALTSERPYKRAWTLESAVSHIEAEAGSHFDPAVTRCLRPALAAIQQIILAFSDPAVHTAPGMAPGAQRLHA